MAAERDATARYIAAFLADRVGNEFEGRVTGVTRFGLFIRLDETQADGLAPISSLGNEALAPRRNSARARRRANRRALSARHARRSAPGRSHADQRRLAVFRADRSEPPVPGWRKTRQSAQSRGRDRPPNAAKGGDNPPRANFMQEVCVDCSQI